MDGRSAEAKIDLASTLFIVSSKSGSTLEPNILKQYFFERASAVVGAAEAGIRYKGRPDLMMMVFPRGTTVAGVFTRNRCPGAPIDWCRRVLDGGRARALVVNAGNANVFTGKAGVATVKVTAKAAGALADCPATQVFLASTGVIGEVLPADRITEALPALAEALTEDGWEDAARAIVERLIGEVPSDKDIAAAVAGVLKN